MCVTCGGKKDPLNALYILVPSEYARIHGDPATQGREAATKLEAYYSFDPASQDMPVSLERVINAGQQQQHPAYSYLPQWSTVMAYSNPRLIM